MSIFSKKIHSEAFTYDDVLLLPAYSEVLPQEIDISTQLTKNIKLNIPIISAAMDTVTEADLAIAMAHEGGIGFIHKNMSIQKQADQVRAVKRFQSGMIRKPYTLNYKKNSLKNAKDLMEDRKIGGIPVIDDQEKLVGIITNRDIRFHKDFSISISKIMTKKKLITASEKISLEEAEEKLKKYKIEKLPIIASNGKLEGLITYKDILKNKNKPNACKDGQKRLRVGAAVGVTSNTLKRVEMLKNADVDIIAVDTAHGNSKRVIQVVKDIKKKYPELDIIAGNVATSEGAKALAEAGADAIKVGIGPGSICTTRIIAGIGVPQLSAVMKVAEALEGSDIPIIADGGIRFSGDIVKAIAGGANVVMIGSLLAGTEEASGKIIIYEGKKFKSYQGMGSLEAMERGSKDRYFQNGENDIKKLVPEGIAGRVPYKGKVSEILYQLIGGLRAGISYCGNSTIAEHRKKAEFIKITYASVKESHPHDIYITREASNYSKKIFDSDG